MTRPSFARGPRHGAAAFTLVELLISMALLSFLLLILVGVTDSASRAWREGISRTDTFQSARTSLEIIARELTPAVVDTRMQFVVASGALLSDPNVGALNVAKDSPAILWMAPLGEDGGLRCVGYYLYRDEAKSFYRLKRIFIAPTTAAKASPYFPRMFNKANPQDATLRTSPTDAVWFTRSWDAAAFNEEDTKNTESVVSSASDGVIAFWVQCIDVLGNPIPPLSTAAKHPKTNLTANLSYNSAAFFQVATTTPFDNGNSVQYLARTEQTMKANRVPAAVDLTVVVLDNKTIARGVKIPDQVNVPVTGDSGTLDVEASLQQFETLLRANKIMNARTFTTRVKLINGN